MTPILVDKEFALQPFFWQAALYREDVELVEEAFQRLGYQPEFEKVVWEDKEKLLSDGTIDCLWSSYSVMSK